MLLQRLDLQTRSVKLHVCAKRKFTEGMLSVTEFITMFATSSTRARCIANSSHLLRLEPREKHLFSSRETFNLIDVV